ETTGSADQRGVTGADVRGLVEVLEVTRADHADALLRWAEVGKPCLLLQPADRPEVLAAEYGPRRRHRPDFARRDHEVLAVGSRSREPDFPGAQRHSRDAADDFEHAAVGPRRLWQPASDCGQQSARERRLHVDRPYEQPGDGDPEPPWRDPVDVDVALDSVVAGGRAEIASATLLGRGGGV